MKNETKTKETKKDAAKTNKQPAKKPSAESKGDAATATQTATITVYGVMKETAQIETFSVETVKQDLSAKHTDSQIEKMLSGEKAILPSENTMYSTDKGKLESLIEQRGWNTPVPVPETETETIDPTTPVEEAASDLTYEMDEQTGGDENAIDAEIDLNDPNEPIYDAFHNQETFRNQLNKKETELAVSLSSGKKLFASLTDAQKTLWTAIQAKYTKFTEYAKPETDQPGESSESREAGSGGEDQEPLENFRKPAEETALARTDDVIQGLIEPEDKTPLSEDEKRELIMREKAVETAKDQFEKAPFIMAENLAAIRRGKLHRETGLNFGEYVADRFGITREYAQALATGGDFRQVLEEVSGSTMQLLGSMNATNEWLKNTNQIAESLGLGKAEFDVMKPIIAATAQLVADISTDKDGKLTPAAPRVFSAVTDIITEIVKTGTVTIDGKQMTIEEAKATGVLGLAAKSEMVETVAEQIQTKKQTIIDYYNERKETRTKPHEAAPPPTPKKKENVFTGVVPTYSAQCSQHKDFGDNYVLNVFNAGFELACHCKYQKLTTSGDMFVCIETDGKTVSHD